MYNKFTPFHGEMLRRMATIFRNMEGLTAVGQWLPHVPFTLYPGVFASEFRNETHSFFTLVNRDDEHKYGEQMRVPCTAASRFFDVYRGHELRHPCSGSLATLNFAMVRRQQTNHLDNDHLVLLIDEGCSPLPQEPLGLGAILHSNDGSMPPTPFMETMREMTAAPLADFDRTWYPIQQELTPNEPTEVIVSTTIFPDRESTRVDTRSGSVKPSGPTTPRDIFTMGGCC